MLAGTPRGFNLQNFGMNPMASMNFGPGGFPAFFGNRAVGAAAGWMGAADPGGAIRRGAGRFQNARPGPYDRRQGGNQRFENGRLSPPPGGGRRGSGMGGGGGRWGDGASGGAAVGPREAVAGRSLKSYEDLDAVAGGGSGELNY